MPSRRYATFCALAGVDPSDSRAALAGLPPIDSLNLWPLVSGANATSPRTEVVLGSNVGNVGFVQGIIRSDGWKYLRGQLVMDFWQVGLRWHRMRGVVTGLMPCVPHSQGPFYPNATTGNTTPAGGHWCGIPGGPINQHCLFNVFDDPSEYIDQSSANPTIVNELALRAIELEQTLFAPVRGRPGNASCDAANTYLRGFIGPFLP